MGQWADYAVLVIEQIHASIPETATYDERRKALSAAYPFGQRKYSPYKTWLRHCKRYLAKYAPKQELPLSPLERIINDHERKNGLG